MLQKNTQKNKKTQASCFRVLLPERIFVIISPRCFFLLPLILVEFGDRNRQYSLIYLGRILRSDSQLESILRAPRSGPPLVSRTETFCSNKTSLCWKLKKKEVFLECFLGVYPIQFCMAKTQGTFKYFTRFKTVRYEIFYWIFPELYTKHLNISRDWKFAFPTHCRLSTCLKDKHC